MRRPKYRLTKDVIQIDGRNLYRIQAVVNHPDLKDGVSSAKNLMRKPKINIGKVYAVGGCVRDYILGLPENDVDYVIVGSTEDEMESSGFAKVGKSFPVYLDDEGYEYALARTEVKSGHGYDGFTTNVNGVTLEEDLKRRDLTINSICYDFETNEYIDPLGGIKDLENGILRMSNQAAFVEDPLRVLRLARFNSRFDSFTIDTVTKCAIVYDIPDKITEFKSISAERIKLEFEKMWNQCSDPSIFFRVLYSLGVLEIITPEISNLRRVIENPAHHPEGNTFEHTMLALKKAKEMNLDVDCMWIILTHDFGKYLTRDTYSHLHHDTDGVEIVEGFCNRLRLTSVQTAFCKLFCEQHMRLHKLRVMKSFKVADLFDKCRVYHTRDIIEKIAECGIADIMGREKEGDIPFSMDEVGAYVEAYRKISGNDVIKLFGDREKPIPKGDEFQHQLKILRGIEITRCRRKL